MQQITQIAPREPITLAPPMPAIDHAAATAHTEQRIAPRRRVLKSGIATFNNRTAIVRCTIREMSETGAKIQADDTRLIPDRFDLVNEFDGVVAAVAVIWRRGAEIGVEFLSAFEPFQTMRDKQVVRPSTGATQKPTLRKKPVTA